MLIIRFSFCIENMERRRLLTKTIRNAAKGKNPISILLKQAIVTVGINPANSQILCNPNKYLFILFNILILTVARCF